MASEELKALASRFRSLFTRGTVSHGKGWPSDDPARETDGKMAWNFATVPGEPEQASFDDHLAGKSTLGLSPLLDDGTATWGAIDVDRYDLEHGAIATKIKAAGLPLITARTKSGGAHLYVFFSEPVKALAMIDWLRNMAAALGVTQNAEGKTCFEIFPKTHKYEPEKNTQPLTLPYFESRRTLRYAVDTAGAALSLEEFLTLAEDTKAGPELLETELAPVDADMEGAPPCIQAFAVGGFPSGSRKKGLVALTVFAKKKWSDDWKKKVEEFNARYCSPPLDTTEVQDVQKSFNRKDYFYSCKDTPLITACDRTRCLKCEYGIGGTSDSLGIDLGQLWKIDTKPPTYILEVDGVRTEFQSEEILNIIRFQLRVMEERNVIINRIKKFTELMQEKMKTMIVLPAPEDAGQEGELMNHLSRWAENRATSERSDVLSGKCLWEDGNIMFRFPDLQTYLMARRFTKMPAKDIWAVIRRRGGTNMSFRTMNQTVKVWSMPMERTTSEGMPLPAPPEGAF